jgi:hypothetical protein
MAICTVETHVTTNRALNAGEVARPVLDLILNGRSPDFAALVEAISTQDPLECSCGSPTCAVLPHDTRVFSQGVVIGILGAASFASAAARVGDSPLRPLHIQLHQSDIEIVRDDAGRVSGTREKEGHT